MTSVRELRRWGRAGALFGAILLLGALPWPGWRERFSAAFCAVSNAFTGDAVFGRNGHARMTPSDSATSRDFANVGGADDNVSADATLHVRVQGYTGELALGLNVRREAYLPLLLTLAVVGAAPIAQRAKARCLAVGLPIVFAFALVTVWLLAVYTFALRMDGIYQLGPFATSALDFVFRAVLLPPGSRFIVALVVSLSLVAARVTDLSGRGSRPPPS